MAYANSAPEVSRLQGAVPGMPTRDSGSSIGYGIWPGTCSRHCVWTLLHCYVGDEQHVSACLCRRVRGLGTPTKSVMWLDNVG